MVLIKDLLDGITCHMPLCIFYGPKKPLCTTIIQLKYMYTWLFPATFTDLDHQHFQSDVKDNESQGRRSIVNT